MMKPARSRYGATRPAVLDWFKRYNEGRPYAEQVKPFNFMLTLFTRRQEDLATEDPTHQWNPKLDAMRPVAPYEKDIDKALRRVFDRSSDSQEVVPRKWLRTVADAIRDYHRQPEYKFLGGGWNEEGVLLRYVFAETIEDIGKETDGWEEDVARTEDQEGVLVYPASSFDRGRMIETIKSVGKRELMREARIAMRTIDAAWAGQEVDDGLLKRMAQTAERIAGGRQNRDENESTAVAWLNANRDQIGLGALADLLCVDASNLGKVIAGKRRPSRAFLARIVSVQSQKGRSLFR